MRKTRHILEYVAFRIASGLLGMMPLRLVAKLGGWLGEKVLTVLRFRRSIVLENLRYAFPHASEEEIWRIARKSFRSVGTTLFELLWYPSLSADHLKSITHFSDHDLFRTAHARNKGVILLTAHFGNWELLPQAIRVHSGSEFLILYKVQSNTMIDKEIARRRTKFGNPIVPMGIAVREMLRSLREGKSVVMAVDQSAPKESIRMKFFGRDVPVFQGAASFALKTGSALIAAFSVRQPDGTYRIQCREISLKGLSDSDDGIRELTRRHLQETENIIREYPGQWMWMHRRWKHSEERTLSGGSE